MSLAIWDPFREMEQLLDRYGRTRKQLPETGETGAVSIASADWQPLVDISETENEYCLHTEIPGVDKKDVKVSVKNDILTVQGSRDVKTEKKDKKFHRVERYYGNFLRSFSLPDNADAEKISADFNNGMLNVSIPKLPVQKPRGIEIKVK